VDQTFPLLHTLQEEEEEAEEKPQEGTARLVKQLSHSA
jgi:hypothetical protein